MSMDEQSQTNETRSGKTASSSRYRLKYSSTKYTAQKDKVIEARLGAQAKFGIFKKNAAR